MGSKFSTISDVKSVLAVDSGHSNEQINPPYEHTKLAAERAKPPETPPKGVVLQARFLSLSQFFWLMHGSEANDLV